MSPQPSTVARPRPGISRGLVGLLAVAAGAAVANLYYAQPLLHTLAGAFGVAEGTAGLLVTGTQIGYVLGLALLVPLGDLRERRSLIAITLVLTAAGLAAASLSTSFVVFGLAMMIVGTTTVAGQVIVPMSSSLAAEHERGRVVGTVMSGLLTGILLARTISGLVAAAFGWRVVFAAAAVAMLVLAAVLRRKLPKVPPTVGGSYAGLLRSVLGLVSDQPVLRQRMLLGSLSYGCFTILWTSLAFLLSGAPYRYGDAVIGLFGLAGLTGALAASVAGRLADRGRGGKTVTGGMILLLASWGLLAAGGTSVVALIVGIAALDFGVQALLVSHQNAIYALDADARSRLTTAYMVAYFIGGAGFSALSSSLYAVGGWGAVCGLGAATTLVALGLWVWTEGRLRGRIPRRRALQSEPPPL